MQCAVTATIKYFDSFSSTIRARPITIRHGSGRLGFAYTRIGCVVVTAFIS
jgi:hypothetical protein